VSRIVVVGDALLDRDVSGDVTRLAPDAPVPVVERSQVTDRPGGAGLAALLAARDGHTVALITAVADDPAGRRLRQLLADAGVAVHTLPIDGATPTKTRIGDHDRPLLRLDDGDGRARPDAELPPEALAALDAADAVLVADYGRGAAAAAAVRSALAAAARRRPVVWDPHPRGEQPVAGVSLATPNAAEAARACPEVTGDGLPAVARRAALLVERWHSRSVAITRGAAGAVLSFGAGSPLALPAPPVRCVDPCGAGDRFAATAAAALAGGAVPSEAVAAAVQAASAFVAVGGARGLAASADEAAGGVPAGDDAAGAVPTGTSRAAGREVLALAGDLGHVDRVRASGGRVVATGGCFDLLHAGHVATLEAARRLGDCLVVCLNSDASVRRLKGEGRPVVGECDRARVLAALESVDAVVVFGEETPHRLLGQLRPDVWVKGGDYTAETLPESELVESWGGTVVVVPYLADRSTTRLVHLITADTR
jgi:rfaE bifunctional protein nucleotidyltransferase chain/domain/rfaE bifunctional protein kinase chain/domain